MANITMLNAAGVTFSNPDGEKHQDILYKLASKQRFYVAELKETTFDGKRAVEVWIENKLIGYIPKPYLMCAISRFYKLTAMLDCYQEKNIWFVRLSIPQLPTSEQKAAMQYLCEENAYEAPIDDIRAYEAFYHEHGIDDAYRYVNYHLKHNSQPNVL